MSTIPYPLTTFIGAGNMVSSMIAGLIAPGVPCDRIAVDDDRKPVPVPPLHPFSPDERRRYAAAEMRKRPISRNLRKN